MQKYDIDIEVKQNIIYTTVINSNIIFPYLLLAILIFSSVHLL